MTEHEPNYVFYGAALEPLEEDEVRKKPIPIEDQIVLDKNGKRRFHGAFTGGFAAGYWNTVGSEEGWKPSSFQSSRIEKAERREQRPEDFMDDEDQEEFGIAPKVLRARQEFGAVSRESKKIFGDTLGVAKILQPVRERIGERILRSMGWRHGEGIGPKIIRQKKIERKKVPCEIEMSQQEASMEVSEPRANITEIEGDLFSAPSHFALAHCVGQDFAMKKGIAAEFKYRFGRVSQLLNQNKSVGEVSYLLVPTEVSKIRYVFYLITKPSTFDYKPDPAMVNLCLQNLCKACLKLKVNNLAMPRICTGLDHMDWNEVLEMIHNVFGGTNIKITVYNLPGSNNGSVSRTPSRVIPTIQFPEGRSQTNTSTGMERRIYGCSRGPVATQSPPNSDSEDSDEDIVSYAPEDLPACLVQPKTNTFGMGYTGLNRKPVLSGGHINLFDISVMNAPKPGVSGIRGQAFGVGAFEAEDEDIYGTEDMSRYDFSLESSSERKRKKRWEQENAKKHKGQDDDCLSGFKKATKPLATIKCFAPPILPKDFTPQQHKARKSRFSERTVQPNDEHRKKGLGRHDMTAEERSVLIGEAKTKVLEPALKSESNEAVMEDFTVEPAVLKEGQLNPFTHDAEKQLRYLQFLTLVKKEKKNDLYKLQPKSMTDWEKQREMREFTTASALFRVGPMDDRFVSSATLLGSEEVSKMAAPQVEASVQAAKMKMYGKLTRTREPWQPHSLVCKRFNIPEPNSGTLVPTKRKVGFSVFDFLAAAPQNTISVDKSSSHDETSVEQSTEQPQPSTVSMESPTDKSEQPGPSTASTESPADKPEQQKSSIPENYEERLDFYRAIFLSSSEDEDDDEPFSQPPAVVPPTPKKTLSNLPQQSLLPLDLRVADIPLPGSSRSQPSGVFACIDKVLAPTTAPELPPDIYGPALPSDVPEIAVEQAQEPPRPPELLPSGSRWVEKLKKKKKKNRSHSSSKNKSHRHKEKKSKKKKKRKGAKKNKRESKKRKTSHSSKSRSSSSSN